LITEMFNTALEKTIDIYQKSYHPLAKAAKDIAAGAVLLSALMAVIMGLIIFLF
jgi:diacylglycerol kinase